MKSIHTDGLYNGYFYFDIERVRRVAGVGGGMGSLAIVISLDSFDLS